MKLNISYPAAGTQKCIVVEDEKKLHSLYDLRMAQEVSGDDLGDQFKGYVFKIMGGNDKQGFPMKQGILTNTRVRVLMAAGSTCYRPRRKGERKRKSVRGCIVGPDISVLHLVTVKKGDEEIEGLTDKYQPRKLGPKRASKIRKLYNLTKEDDVRKYVIRRELQPKEGAKEKAKKKTKAPKIQRLVTPQRLQRKRREIGLKKKRQTKAKNEAHEYKKLLSQRNRERQEKRKQSISKRKQRESGSTTTTATTTTAAPVKSTQSKPTTTTTKPTTAPVKSTQSKPTTTTTTAPVKSAPQKQPTKASTKTAPAKK